MKTASFQYKCRRCGGVSENPHTSIENAARILVCLVFNLAWPDTIPMGVSPEIYDIHICPDGGSGVCDLLGYKVKEE